MKPLNLIGQKFGRLTVISKSSEKTSNKIKWCCLCDCGNTVVVTGQDLKSGNTKSCGCLRKEVTSKRAKKHGMKRTKLYYVWTSMKNRCTNPKVYAYSRYGGRGIRVCDEWQTFPPFLDWAMKSGYKEGLSLDRIDNDGDYKPSNCRWATKEEQSENTSQNVFLTYNGETHTIAQWCKIVGSYEARLSWRYKQGWPVEEILFGRGGPKLPDNG